MSDYDYLIDSDLLIEHLRQRAAAIEFLEQLISESIVSYSVVTEAEIFVGVRSGEIEQTELLLDQLVRLNLDSRMPRLAANFRREYGKSHGTELADALIAATAAVHNLVLVSYNYRHFPMKELNLICPPRGNKPARVIRGVTEMLPQIRVKESRAK